MFIGSACDIQNTVDFRLGLPFDNDCFIKLGNSVFNGRPCEFVCNPKIIIGNDCLIACNPVFNDTGHKYRKFSKINMQPIKTRRIIIEDDFWIGISCSVLQGVIIGRSAVTVDSSVVNKSIPQYQVWAGVPARFIKIRN